jgi:hypothetical protein
VSAVQIAAKPITRPVSDPTSENHPPKPYDIVQGMEHVISMMEDTLQICERAQCSTRATPPPGTSPLVCNHLATSMLARRSSPPRSNLGGGNPPATSSLNSAQVVTRSTYYAPTIMVHGTPSATAA